MPAQSFSTEFFFPVLFAGLALLAIWKYAKLPAPRVQEQANPQPQAGVDPSADISLRVVLPGGQTHACTLPADSSVAALKARVFPSNHGSVVLVFMGRRLEDSQTLAQCGVGGSSVIHAQVASSRPESSQPAASPPFALLLCSSMLVLLWWLFLSFPELFEGVTRVLLVLLTLLCCFFAKSWLLG